MIRTLLRSAWAAAALAAAALSGCNSDEEILGRPAPEIILSNPSGVYTVKTGRELLIAPEYRNAEEAVYVWLLDGEPCGDGPAYRFVGEEEGSRYLDLRVTTPGGTAAEQLRIDVEALTPPYITLPGAAEGFDVAAGTELHLAPVVQETLPATFAWSVDGTEVAATREYTFVRTERGIYTLRFAATNEDGTEHVEFAVRVCSEEELPFGWEFDRTEFGVTTGRTLTVRPVSLRNEAGAEFVWTLDGTEVQRGTQSEYVFRAGGEPATHTLEAAMNKGGQSLRRQFTITVHPPKAGYRPATSASRAACNAVYAFLPAPGQFVQFGYSAATMEEACAHARKTLEDPEAGLSLGAFGGTLVVGFDHSIDRTEGYELAIQGNPFEGSSEPGIVWVMQDENGNGLPDDTWYELKGSAWDDPDVVRGYAVTYYRPSGPGTDVVWRDNRGGGGILPRLEFHTQDYFYPLWADDGGTSYTLRGTLLPDRAYDQSEGTGEEEYWVLPDFGWGYADNWSAEAMDPDHGNLFRIADAVDDAGNPADLEYIDFVKVQTAQMAVHGRIGEASTEVFAIGDYTLLRRK